MEHAAILEQFIGLAGERAGQAIASIPKGGLLLAALGAIAAGALGSLVVARFPALGRMLRRSSTLGLMAVLVLVVVQLARLDPRSATALPSLALPAQRVAGQETRVPLAPDGHYWLQAMVNGHQTLFLVDTGATLTAVSPETARLAGLAPRSASRPLQLQTANGTVEARITTIEELRFGNVVARGLEAIIAPGMGETNVLGMNLLSRLAAVRIEEGQMILVPHHPQPPVR